MVYAPLTNGSNFCSSGTLKLCGVLLSRLSAVLRQLKQLGEAVAAVNKLTTVSCHFCNTVICCCRAEGCSCNARHMLPVAGRFAADTRQLSVS